MPLPQTTHRLGVVVRGSHSRRGLLGLVPQSSVNFVCRWYVGLLAEAVHERVPGYKAQLTDKTNMSGAGGETIRAVSLSGCLF